MESNSKINSFGYKLTAAIIILIMLAVCFLNFLSQFNELYQIDSSGIGLRIKTSSSIEANSFILLFGFLASIGSLVRVIYDYIGHTCYTQQFDFRIWWPWYFFRPILGFILGAILVVFFDKSLFGNNINEISKSPFILSFITGFAVTDAISFLREISKRIFGINGKNEKAD